MTARNTIEQFITRAHLKHNNKYDYSQSIYINTHTKITICCPLHGNFVQRPNRHLLGDGCPKCGGLRASMAKTKDTDHFIRESIKVHGIKYCYAKTEYNGVNRFVTITCPRHGDFTQRASDHIHAKAGCPGCGNEMKRKSKLLTPEDIVDMAARIHTGKYLYDSASIIDTIHKMTVTCRKHGTFHVTPTNHIHNKSGCPKCNTSKGERTIQSLLEENDVHYVMQHTFSSCKSPKGYKLRFDFFIPSMNLVIEYDGEHHFQPTFVRGLHALSQAVQLHENTKINDDIKNLYVMNNNINMLRIPYYEKHNIAHILTINNVIIMETANHETNTTTSVECSN